MRKVSREYTLPAPTGGWNARDNLGEMKENQAVFMINTFPNATEVSARKGYTQWATGFTSQVETILTYEAGASSELFAVSGGDIYDITATGPITTAVHTGLNNSRLEFVNFSNTSGIYLYMVNGANAPLTYNGTTWANPTLTFPSGVSSDEMSSINMHKNRVWFTRSGTLEAYYLDPLAISGTASLFDLSSVAQLGGELVASATWSIDAGTGLDDLMVFFTSEGEVIVYRGTDPTTAADWLLVGVFRIGAPVGGARCWIKYAGDVLVTTTDGVEPLSGALQSSRTNPRVAISDIIQPAINTAVTSYAGNFGWQLLDFPKGNMLILNVPVSEGGLQEQYVMNSVTKAWCKFTGWNANCFSLFNDMPYFGSSTYVGLAWTNNSDNGENITADTLQSFQPYGNASVLKRFTMARPIIRSNGNPSILANVNLDYDIRAVNTSLLFSPSTRAKWGTAKWNQSKWGGSQNIIKNWQGLNGIGFTAGIRMQIVYNGITCNWISTTIVTETGGVI